MNSPAPRRPLPGSFGLVVICLASVAALTLAPQPSFAVRNPVSFGIGHGASGQLDLIANALLFAPLGCALWACGLRARISAILLLLTSASIEAAQLAVPGRYPALVDVVLNTLGGTAGFLGCRGPMRPVVTTALGYSSALAARVVDSTPVAARWMAATLAIATVAVPTLAGRAARPEIHQGTSVLAGPAFMVDREPLAIGGTGLGPAFCGRIDGVRLYTRALTTSEVAAAAAGSSLTTQSAADPTLAAAFELDEGSGQYTHDLATKTAVEVDGNLWTATGHSGAALTFAGGPEAMVSDLPQRPREAVTLMAWVWPERPSCGEHIVGTRSGSIFLEAGSEAQALQPVGGGTFATIREEVNAVESLPLQRWSHLALTYDGVAMRLYVNGEKVTEHWRAFPGAIDRVEIAGILASPGPLPRALQSPGLLRSGPRISVTLRPSIPLGSQRVPLLRIDRYWVIERLRADMDAETLTIRYRTRLSGDGFPKPEVRVHGPFPWRPSTRHVVSIEGDLRRPTVRIDDGPAQRAGLAPGEWWGLVVHAGLLPWWLRDLGSLSLAALALVPLGYLSMRGQAPVLLAGSTLLGLWLVPPLGGIRGINGIEAMAVATLVAAGALFAVRLPRAPIPAAVRSPAPGCAGDEIRPA